MRAYAARRATTQEFIRSLGEAQRRHRGTRRRENRDYGAERLAETAEARRLGMER
jgi:hypothetical protein